MATVAAIQAQIAALQAQLKQIMAQEGYDLRTPPTPPAPEPEVAPLTEEEVALSIAQEEPAEADYEALDDEDQVAQAFEEAAAATMQEAVEQRIAEEGATPSPPDWDFAGPERAGPEVTADPIRMEEQQARIAPEARQREARTTEDLTGSPSLPPANIGDSPVPEVRTELEEQKVSYQSLPTDEKVERLATLSKPANATERSALRSVALNADRAVPPEVKADMSTEPLETLEFDPGDGVEFAKNEGVSHPFALSAATLLGEREGSKGKPNKKLGPVFNRLASQGVTGPQSDCSWCAAFVTHAVKEAGGKIPTIIAARKFLNVGATVSEGSEQEGDIGVMWNNEASTGGRDGWGGHAIVILSQDENSITGIGGNQDHAVSIMTFPREKFLGVRRIKK